MNVASLELCKELYELSGWNKTWSKWGKNEGEDWEADVRFGEYFVPGFREASLVSRFTEGPPAYDLGYLLRKLPKTRSSYVLKVLWQGTDEQGDWYATYNDYDAQHADTPEDAAAKLAIELFKQGILTK